MLPRLTGAQYSRTRALALVALFMFAAVQGLEAAHSHLDQDSSAHCLVCKNSTDTAFDTAAPAGALPQLYAAPATRSPCFAPASPPPTLLCQRSPGPLLNNIDICPFISGVDNETYYFYCGGVGFRRGDC